MHSINAGNPKDSIEISGIFPWSFIISFSHTCIIVNKENILYLGFWILFSSAIPEVFCIINPNIQEFSCISYWSLSQYTYTKELCYISHVNLPKDADIVMLSANNPNGYEDHNHKKLP